MWHVKRTYVSLQRGFFKLLDYYKLFSIHPLTIGQSWSTIINVVNSTVTYNNKISYCKPINPQMFSKLGTLNSGA